jgi:hypothetical protein
MLFHLIACTVVSYGNRQRLAEGNNHEKSEYAYRHQVIKMRLTCQSVRQSVVPSIARTRRNLLAHCVPERASVQTLALQILA